MRSYLFCDLSQNKNNLQTLTDITTCDCNRLQCVKISNLTNLLTLSNNVYLMFYAKEVDLTNLLTLSNNVYLMFYAKEVDLGT